MTAEKSQNLWISAFVDITCPLNFPFSSPAVEKLHFYWLLVQGRGVWALEGKKTAFDGRPVFNFWEEREFVVLVRPIADSER